MAGAYLPTPEGWKAELAWVAGYVERQFTCPKAVTHPTTNRAQCRATALIETNALPLHWRTKWKKRSAATQTLRAGCSKAEPKNFSPRHRPPSRRRRTAKNLISWIWSLPLPINPVWRGTMHAISSYRGNRPTNTHTNRQRLLQYTSFFLAPCATFPPHFARDSRLSSFFCVILFANK